MLAARQRGGDDGGSKSVQVQPEPSPKPPSSEYLLFNPQGAKAWLKETFKEVPRYLFCLQKNRYPGWAHSQLAVYNEALDGNSTKEKNGMGSYTDASDMQWMQPHIDIFDIDNDLIVVNLLEKYLDGSFGSLKPSNFKSWTSSLPFAIQYMLRANEDNVTTNLSLTVVDTTMFPEGTFIRDLEIIRPYERFSNVLQRFRSDRNKVQRVINNSHRGEYLSQGWTKIEGKCASVLVKALLSNGHLYNALWNTEERSRYELQVPTEESPRPEPQVPTAADVVLLRERLLEHRWHNFEPCEDRLQHVLALASNFGGSWRLPLTIAFLSLWSHSLELDTLSTLEETFMQDYITFHSGAELPKVVLYASLPELNLMKQLVRLVYTRFHYAHIMQIQQSLHKIELDLLKTGIVSGSLRKTGGLPQANASSQQILQSCKTISFLANSLQKSLSMPQRQKHDLMPNQEPRAMARHPLAEERDLLQSGRSRLNRSQDSFWHQNRPSSSSGLASHDHEQRSQGTTTAAVSETPDGKEKRKSGSRAVTIATKLGGKIVRI